MLSESGRAAAQIYRNVKNTAFNDAYQFALWLLSLVVQTTQYVFNRAAVVILDEIRIPADNLFKLTVIKTLEKETSIIAIHSGFDDEHVLNSSGCDFQTGVPFCNAWRRD